MCHLWHTNKNLRCYNLSRLCDVKLLQKNSNANIKISWICSYVQTLHFYVLNEELSRGLFLIDVFNYLFRPLGLATDENSENPVLH